MPDPRNRHDFVSFEWREQLLIDRLGRITPRSGHAQAGGWDSAKAKVGPLHFEGPGMFGPCFFAHQPRLLPMVSTSVSTLRTALILPHITPP